MRRAALLAPLALLLIAAQGPQPQEALPPDRETVHMVKPGETLGGVANRAKVPRVLIIEANRLEPPYTLKAGQKLVIPRTREHTVIRGETGFTIAYSYGVPWRDIATANNLDPSTRLKPGQKLLIPTVLQRAKPASPAPQQTGAASPAPAASGAPSASADKPRFAWPLPAGTIRRGFVPRSQNNYHDGIDMPVAEGTAVRAAAGGKVIFAGSEPRQFGNLVVVEHTGGWQSAYAFLSRITVVEGDEVKPGERVGLSGRTGQARGPELHFELRYENRAVNPLEHLPERK